MKTIKYNTTNLITGMLPALYSTVLVYILSSLGLVDNIKYYISISVTIGMTAAILQSH